MERCLHKVSCESGEACSNVLYRPFDYSLIIQEFVYQKTAFVALLLMFFPMLSAIICYLIL